MNRLKNNITIALVRCNRVVEEHQCHNLITNLGRDWLANMYGNLVVESARHIGLSPDTTAVLVTDTELANEYTDYGLSRAAATFAHAASTDYLTYTHTWTCTADSKVVGKAGLFTGYPPQPTKGTTTVLDLSTTTQLTLGGATTNVDITVDTRSTGSNVLLGWSAAPGLSTAPYWLKSGGSTYSFEVHPDDGLTMYFAADGAPFASGDVLRIQEWELTEKSSDIMIAAAVLPVTYTLNTTDQLILTWTIDFGL